MLGYGIIITKTTILTESEIILITINRDPTYNLKVVIQETGIKPDTLRAWERRYGLPQPDRTSGGHRLYSDYDIEMIKWFMARQDEGMRINRAIKLWKSIEAEGSDPLEAMPYGILTGEPSQPLTIVGTNLDEMRQEWIAACLAFDEQSAEQVLAQSFARYPLESVCLEVLRKGLSEIGTLWYEGEATVQQEHFASALALRRLNSLITASPPATRSDTILIACPPEEEHIFAPLLVSLFLRQRGWNVVYLGADVPITNIEKAVKSTNSKLVISTATLLYTAANMQDVGELLRSEKKAFAYGGSIFNRLPGLRKRISGYFLGEHLENVVPTVERYLYSQPRIPEREITPIAYLVASEQFADQQPSIEALVWTDLKGNGIKQNSLTIANEYLAKNIIAALKLGNMEFLKPEIDWVESLIINYGLKPSLLPEYLNIYAAAVRKEMPEYGYIAAEFLEIESEKLS